MNNTIIKKNSNIILLFLLCIMGLVSCEKFLEIEPKDQITDNTVWGSTGNADLFLNGIYASLRNVYNQLESEDPWSDDAMAGYVHYDSRAIYSRSDYTPSNAPSYWNQYNNIRKCNVFITKVEAAELPDSWKKQRLAEARFLRAYSYQLLWTHYGGVPIITDILSINSQGDAIFRGRNSDAETFKFITDECGAIANDLPIKSDAGRATRGAALTLKGWCELFEASPLKNPDNVKEKWALAAATNKMVIDLAAYDLFPDLETMFFEENNYNQEVIFARSYLGGTTLGGSKEGLWGLRNVGGAQVGYGGMNPTQELVDDYAMANGLPISDPSSGYNPQNPYVNREKRFYQSIIHDECNWLGYIIITKQGVGSKNATDLTNGSGAGPNTGYALRKSLDPKYAVSGSNRLNSACFIIFRYAEVLLNYAEAQNEASGPDDTVYEAINSIRERSELPVLPVGLTQEQMRDAIRRERRVELAFEEKRWYDLIRWKTAEINLNTSLHCMVIEKINDIWVYDIRPAADGGRVFYANKNYVFPIPQNAIDKNSNLEQNPNY